MSLVFTYNEDQAILAYTIKTAADLAAKSGGYVGRTAVQKIIYFLGVRGVSMNYKFDIYHYGPFCEQILWDIDLLLADNVIKDQSINTEKFSKYTAGLSIEDLIELHKSRITEIADAVHSVVKTLVPLNPQTLELIATLDYVYRQELAKGFKGDLKQKVLSRFLEIKKDKFPAELVSTTYDSLESAHLVRSSL